MSATNPVELPFVLFLSIRRWSQRSDPVYVDHTRVFRCVNSGPCVWPVSCCTDRRSGWPRGSAARCIQTSGVVWIWVWVWPGWSCKCPGKRCTETPEARTDKPRTTWPSWSRTYRSRSGYWCCWDPGWACPARRRGPCRKPWSWRRWNWAPRTWTEMWEDSWSWRKWSSWWTAGPGSGPCWSSCCRCKQGTCRRTAAWGRWTGAGSCSCTGPFAGSAPASSTWPGGF